MLFSYKASIRQSSGSSHNIVINLPDLSFTAQPIGLKDFSVLFFALAFALAKSNFRSELKVPCYS